MCTTIGGISNIRINKQKVYMSRIISRAESWERAYEAFSNVNFAAFDYNTVKQSIIDYIKLYFPETFNDFIESSELISIIEVFAYIAELLAYRVDVSAHENFISTAQRKDSILRLAKLVSYTATRPLPSRGLVKITSVATTEPIIDASGNDLSNRAIKWNDSSNVNWKDQFIQVMNRVLEQDFGSVGPTDRFQLDDVLFELYSWNLNSLQTGVFSYSANINGRSEPMELVPISYNKSIGITERRPENNANFTILYGQDGLGDSSDTTGFFCFTKQGTLQKFKTSFDGITPNLTFDIPSTNINDTDVWVNAIDPATGSIRNVTSQLPYKKETLQGKSGEWIQVDLAHAQNVIFNTNPKRNKYELETRDNNQVRIIFGDGEFADIPQGAFEIWARTSLDADSIVPQASVVNAQSSFTYVDTFGRTQTFTFTFSLISSLQNGSSAEDIEHIRVTAPAVYYSQDRMVNGEDYNVFMLQDPSILKLRAVNRTFAGDSKYIPWHDPSGSYENVKLFGNDGVLYFEDTNQSQVTPPISVASLVTSYIQPLLSSSDIYLWMATIGVPLTSYRRTFDVTEIDRLTTTLTPPPTPTQAQLFYNFVTFEWYSIKTSDSPTSLPNWPTNYITTPLILVDQTSIFESKYIVTRVSKKLVFESSTTRFWNTNDANKVVNYDTLIPNSDTITILQANLNYNRSNVLTKNWAFNVLGQQTLQYGSNVGLPDIHRLSIISQDENNDGIPDNLVISDDINHKGVADIMMPKYQIDLPANISVDGTVITLPITCVVTQSNNTSTDVEVYANGTLLTSGVNWTVVPGVNNYVFDKIKLSNNIYNFAAPGAKLTIKIKEYVYFFRNTISEQWIPITTSQSVLVNYAIDQIDQTFLWKRHQGRDQLNFAWFHNSPRYHLIDPASSNIIDMFVITKGYYTGIKRWLEDSASVPPTLPTPAELKTSYGYLLDNKMISDTVVLHPGKIKLLFGRRSPPQLQGKFKVIKSADRTLTDNQIKTIIVTTIRNFFTITTTEFGQSFYATELYAAIHISLPTEINSVVLVPTLSTNQFGDLFQIFAGEDEILYPDITVQDIELVSGYTTSNLRLNG